MTPLRRSTWPAWAVVTFAAACSHKLEGPAPDATSVSPKAVCNRQLDTPVTLAGTGFSPLLESALVSSRELKLPALALTRAENLDGASASGDPLQLPDDPAAPEQSVVRWLSQEQMRFTVKPSLALADGLHDVTVTNANGKSDTLPKALLAVPPPALTSIDRDIACAAQANTFQLTGSMLIQGGVVKVGGLTLTPTSTGGCRALPGDSGLQACTSFTFDVAADQLMADAQTITVKNPDPVACSSESSLTLTLFDRPHVTSVMPLAICSQAAMQRLSLEGTGFLEVDGTGPTLSIGAQTFTPTLSGCTAVTGTKEMVRSCTGLTLDLQPGTLAPGSYQVTLHNPSAVGCDSSETYTLVVAPPPTITSVAPMTVCAGSATLTLTGTGFQMGAKVMMNGIDASSVTVNAAGTTAVAVLSAGLMPGGPYPVTLTNPDTCGATSSAAVTVVPGPQLFFADPPVVYNGISTQATLYGTGFTGAVQSVSLVPQMGAPIPLTFTTSALRPGQVQVVIPAMTPAGTYSIELHDTTVCSAVLADAVQVVSQTTLTLGNPPVVPEFGATSSSTGVTINGSGFVAVPRLYLNPTMPSPGTVATAVGAVAMVDGTKLTAVVPAGLAAGSYDLIVVNPDLKVGVATAAFRVTALPPPEITSLSPGSVPNTNPQTFTVNGKNFRMSTASLRCIDALNLPLATSPAAMVTMATATALTVSFNASVAGVACVVRVTNGDDQTFADFSALVITNPAQNLYVSAAGPDLQAARRAPIVLGGDATTAARFVHVIGGDDGVDGGTALDSVESSNVDLFGVPSPFVTQRTKLTRPRTLAAGARIGRFFYVAGGIDGAQRLDTVERAVVLDPDKRQQVTDLLLTPGTAGLGAGVWYYRVAAVMGSSDPFNPGGENLPSDPFPVRLPSLSARKIAVKVSWASDPLAAKYRVYRSPAAGAAAGAEVLISEVTAPATSFDDDGSLTPGTQQPLPIGSLGAWTVLTPRLSTPREGLAVSWGLDPADPNIAYLYAFGGRTAATTVSSSYEFLKLTLGAQGEQTAAATFTPGSAPLASGRWAISAAQASSRLSARIPSPDTWLYVLSGVAANGSTLVGDTEAGRISMGGQLVNASGTPGFSAQLTLQRAGYAALSTGNHVFAFGGNNFAADTSIVSGEICGAGVIGCGATPSPPKIANYNAGQNMLAARLLPGAVLSGANIYVAGGWSGTAALRSTEYRLW